MNIASMIDQIKAIACAALGKADAANERIDNLPLPMVFKGTLGTGGTISTLPTASSENEGYVYIVITDGTYAGTSAKAGDTFVSDGSSWVLVPSADEPSPIDDSVTSTALTWSSDKINTEFNGVKVKSLSYTGDGETSHDITFPTTPTMILGIYGEGFGQNTTTPFPYGVQTRIMYVINNINVGGNVTFKSEGATYNGNTMTLTGTDANSAFNSNNITYTVYYI